MAGQTFLLSLLWLGHSLVVCSRWQIPITITKPHEKAEVPTGVIVGSVIAGILLLLALVAVLWKVRHGPHSASRLPGPLS